MTTLNDYVLRRTIVHEDDADDITVGVLLEFYKMTRDDVDKMSAHVLGLGENPKDDETIQEYVELARALKLILKYFGYENE